MHPAPLTPRVGPELVLRIPIEGAQTEKQGANRLRIEEQLKAAIKLQS